MYSVLCYRNENWFSLLSGMTEGIPLPSRIQLEPTTKCNFSCKYCNHTLKISKKIDIEQSTIEKVICDLRFNLFEISFSGSGEPLLYPALSHILNYCLKFQIRPDIVTNGSLLNFEYLSELARLGTRLWFSLDGLEPEICAVTRPQTDVDKTINLLKEAGRIRVSHNKEFLPGISFALGYHNLNQVKLLIDFAREFGLWGIMLLPLTTPLEANLSSLDPSVPEVCEILLDALRLALDSGIYFSYPRAKPSQKHYWPCPEAWVSSFIAADGNVYPCVANRNTALGNVNSNSFPEIWNSKQYVKFRHLVLNKKSFCCQNCLWRWQKI